MPATLAPRHGWSIMPIVFVTYLRRGGRRRLRKADLPNQVGLGRLARVVRRAALRYDAATVRVGKRATARFFYGCGSLWARLRARRSGFRRGDFR